MSRRRLCTLLVVIGATACASPRNTSEEPSSVAACRPLVIGLEDGLSAEPAVKEMLAPVIASVSPDTIRYVAVTSLQRPRLLNRPVVQKAFVSLYPRELRDKGLGGTSVYYVLIDDRGRVANRQLAESSGYQSIDLASGRVLTVMEYSQPVLDGCSGMILVRQPLVWSAR